MSILMDSCNVMPRSKNGLETRIRTEKAPHLLDIDGDSCHHMHNTTKMFCKPFGYWVETLHNNLYNDVKWSTDLRDYMKEISFLMGMKFTMPERFVSYRWLLCYDVSVSNLLKLDLYTVFYSAFLKGEDRGFQV